MLAGLNVYIRWCWLALYLVYYVGIRCTTLRVKTFFLFINKCTRSLVELKIYFVYLNVFI